MIVVGIFAYKKAAQGLSDKYKESTLQTIRMATQYLDMSDTYIEAEGTKYAFNSNIIVFYGLFENDPLGKMNVMTNIRSDILCLRQQIHLLVKYILLQRRTDNVFYKK